MSHHRICATCFFTSLLLLFAVSDAEASQWHSSIPEKLIDQIDPINLILTLDDARQGSDSTSAKFLSAVAARERPVISSSVTTPTELQPLHPQSEQMMFNTLQVQYLHTDLLGSVVLETDSNGKAIKTTTYKPFGESVNY